MIYHGTICKNNILENKLLLISINYLEKWCVPMFS